MTQTTDHTPKPAPKMTTAALWAELTPAEKSFDHIRRIHWWVRLFGIIWIVIPIVAFTVMMAFGIGIISKSRLESIPDKPAASGSFARCLTEGYTTAECNRWYPG